MPRRGASLRWEAVAQLRDLADRTALLHALGAHLTYGAEVNTTVVVAAMGFIATLLGGWLGAFWQHRSTRDLRLLDARVRVYGNCAASLYEFERATYNRVKARLDSQSEERREPLRQEAYRCNSSARAAIGQLGVLSAAKDIRDGLDTVRRAIGDLNASASHTDLRDRNEEIYTDLERLLDRARTELAQ